MLRLASAAVRSTTSVRVLRYSLPVLATVQRGCFSSDIGATSTGQPTAPATPSITRSKMISEHKLCMIPGPVEFHEDVLSAMATPATSHVAPSFIDCFGRVLENLRHVLLTTSAQPFVVAGSGTLGWDMTAANLIEPGHKALVLNTGLFGDRFGDCLATYGAEVTQLRAPIGSRPSLEQIEEALKRDGPFRLVTITHVDTSTGVLSDVEAITKLVKRISPTTLVAVDGVCSVAAETIRMDDWAVDVVLTASQKALGAPPGLTVLLASQYAMKQFEERTAPIPGYYVSWKRWLPIMQAYEKRAGSYFGTPPVQLIMALDVSLKQLLKHGMENIFVEHVATSDRVKRTIQGWGLKLVPESQAVAAHDMTAIYYPEGIVAADLLGRLSAHGVVIAGGLHPAINTKYFRIGHMGLSVLEPQRAHVETTMNALKTSLGELGYSISQ